MFLLNRITNHLYMYLFLLFPVIAMAQNPDIKPVVVGTPLVGEEYWVEIHVGSTVNVTNLYGLSLNLKSSSSNTAYVDGSAERGTLLGTAVVQVFAKKDNQTADIGITKTSQPGVNGSGIFARAKFISSVAESVTFSLENITAVDSNGNTITLSPTSLTITPVTPNPSPTVTDVSPSTGLQGASVPVTVTGTGFSTGVTTFSFGNGITVSAVSVTSTTSATMTLAVAEDATAGVRNIVATNPAPGGGTGTLADAFTVTLPPVLQVSPPTANVAAAGGTVTLTITNTGGGILSWTASSEQAWVTVAPTSGTGAGSTVVTLAANTTFDQRTATITVTATGATGSPKTVTITQAGVVQLPTVTTTTASTVTSTTAVLGGNVTSQGSSAVTARGVCISTNESPTVENSDCLNASTAGTGSFTINATNLNPATIYFARAFATSTAGTSYGDNVSFTTPYPVPTITSLSVTSGVQGELLTVPVTGTGFVLGGTTISFGQNILASLTVNSATSATAEVQIAPAAATGARNVTVTNPGPGGGTATLTNGFTVNVAPAPVLTVTPTSITKSAAAGTETITISNTGTGTMAWTAVSSETWLTLSDPSGTGNATLTATFTANTTITSRNATITITAPGAVNSPREITITQAGVVQAPSVTTAIPTSINSASAVLGGNVTSQGSSEVTVRGVCVSTNIELNVTNANCFNAAQAGSGSFSVTATNLNPATIYYARAYATSTVATSYGDVATFTTPYPSPTISEITPNSGVQGQSLNLTLTGTGFVTGQTTISFGNASGITVTSLTITNATTATALIQIEIAAAVGSRNVTITNPGPGGGTTTINSAFTVTVTPNPVLTVTPSTITKTAAAGTETISITNTGTGTLSWTAVSSETWLTLSPAFGSGNATLTATFAANTAINSRTATITITATDAQNSPRTISVNQSGVSQSPTVTTVAATTVSSNSAILGGNVSADGGSAVTARGVCFATTPSPTTANTCVTAAQAGTGIFSVTASNLIPTTLYNARAFATNSAGTSYGENVTFTTLATPLSDLQPTIVGTPKLGEEYWVEVRIGATVPVKDLFGLSFKLRASSNSTVYVDGSAERGFFLGDGAITFFRKVDDQTVDIAVSKTTPPGIDGTGLFARAKFRTTVAGTTTFSIVDILAYDSASEKIELDAKTATVTFSAGPNPSPTINNITPITGNVGQSVSVSVTGTGFVAGATTVSFGEGIQVASLTVNSATTATAQIQISNSAATGTRNVVVTNPAPGGGTATLNAAFTVNVAPVPVLTVTPATITKTSAAGTETISISNTGTGTMAWTAASNQTWLTLSATSGSGNATLTATFTENTTVNSRTATITITATGAQNSPRTIAVSQSGVTQAPTLTTVAAASITSNSAVLGGNVSADGGSQVTSRGICYSITPSPTIENTCLTAAQGGTGAFSVTATNLTPATLYNVRAFAVNTVGTSYGANVTFTTQSAGNPIPTVTSITPDASAIGSTVDVTIIGINFATSGVTVQVGEGVTVSNIARVSATTITARLTVSTTATLGSRFVTVTNPAPGGGVSNSTTSFQVTLPAPPVSSSSWSPSVVRQTPLQPVFDWGSVTGAINYTVQYSNRSTFPTQTSCNDNCTDANANPFTNSHIVTGTNFKVPSFLETGVTHFWRVRANTASVIGVWSQAYPFTTLAPPNIPTLVTPANGATGLTGLVQLVWTATANTTNYQVHVSSNPDFTTLIASNENLTTATFTLPAITVNSPAIYYWRVRSIGIGGNSPWSNVYFYRRAALTSDGGDLSELPADFELLQNYPNPFNPSTNVAFSLPTAAHVTLTVHSILGQEVAVLVNKTMVGGRHVVTFDASKLSSGVYLYRLTAGEFTQTRVMNLVK
jgi:hypothetical protein